MKPVKGSSGRVTSKWGQKTIPTNSLPSQTSRRGSGQDRGRQAEGELTSAASASLVGAQQVRITEKTVSKDYRSFAANVFGTVAFKMLEWLTPNNMEAMAQKVEAVHDPLNTTEGSQTLPSSSDDQDGSISPTSVPSMHDSEKLTTVRSAPGAHRYATSAVSPRNEVTGFYQRAHAEHHTPPNSTIQAPPQHQRRNSNARIRTSSVSKSHTKAVPEPLIESIADETGPISPSIHTAQSERGSKGLIRPPPTISRTSSQLAENDDYTAPETETLEPGSPRSHEDDHAPQLDGVNGEETLSSAETTRSLDTSDETQDSLVNTDNVESTSELDGYLPQSLSRLNIQAVNFICDVLQEDATSERHVLEPPTITGSIKRSSSRLKPWKRRRKSRAPYSQNLKFQWKLFAEQSIFHVLSDPQALLDSFTSSNGVVDSQTLWYCMLRLTRVAPSLVFDSLWIALAGLFAPPKTLQSSRSPTAKVFPVPQKAFTNAQAASLMSICFHALIAAAPLVTDPRQLNDISRIRAHGMSLTGGGSIARPPMSLCLQYEDAFTDDMALRLAMRLLRVIPTRRYFDELIELDLDSEDSVKEMDVLDMLLSHLESSAQSVLNFSKAERSMHEKRVPVLLLDWARAVMLHEWEGKPDVSGDGSFGGALALVAAMC